MKKVLKKFNRTLSIMLAAAMVLTMVPQTAMPVLAAENDEVVEVQTEAPAEDTAPADENDGDEESADVEKTGETPENPADDEQKEEDPEVEEEPSDDNETPVIDPGQDPVDNTEVEEPVEDPAEEVVDPTTNNIFADGEETPVEYTVTDATDDKTGYETNITADSKVAANGQFSFTVKPKDYYKIDSVKAKIGDAEETTLTATGAAAADGTLTYRISNVTANVSITVAASKIKYTVSVDYDDAAVTFASTAITSGKSGEIEAAEDLELSFTAEANEGSKITGVTYSMGTTKDAALTVGEDGKTYKISNVNNNVAIKIASTTACKVTFTAHENIAEVNTIKINNKAANPAVINSESESWEIQASKGDTVSFKLKAADPYKVAKVLAGETEVPPVSNVYTLRNLGADTNITITTELDLTKSYKLTVNLKGKADSAELVSITEGGTAVAGAAFGTTTPFKFTDPAASEVKLTIKPGAGYTVKSVKKGTTTLEPEPKASTPEEGQEESDELVYKIPFVAADKSKGVAVTVETEEIDLEEGVTKTVTFERNGEHLAYTTTATKVEGADDKYTLKKGDKALSFTVTATGAYEPVVTRGESATPLNAVKGRTTGKGSAKKTPYTYSIPATTLSDAEGGETIHIAEQPIAYTLTITGAIDDVNLIVSVDGKVYETPDDLAALSDDITYKVQEDTVVTVQATQKAGTTLTSLVSTVGTKATTKKASKGAAELVVTATDDISIAINTANVYTGKLTTSGDSEVLATKGVYSVSYDGSYKATAEYGSAHSDAVFTKAEILDGKKVLETWSGSAAADAVLSSGNDNKEININIDNFKDKKDSSGKAVVYQGRKLTVNLYTEDNGDKAAVTYALQVSQAITSIKTKSASVKQTADTEDKYPLILSKGGDAGKIDSTFKATAADTNKVKSATIVDGELVLVTGTETGKTTVTVAPQAEGVTTPSYTLNVEVTPILVTKAGMPTVKVEKTDDISITLSLTTKNIATPKAGAVWYEIKATASAEKADSKLKDSVTEYVQKTADTMPYKVELAKEGTTFGQGEKRDYKVDVRLVYTAGKAAPAQDSDIVASGKAKTGTKCSTLAPAYETKLSLKKGATTITTGQESILVATAQFSKTTTYTSIIGAEDSIEDGGLEIDENAIGKGEIVVSSDENTALGAHTITVYAEGGNRDDSDSDTKMQPITAQVKVTVVKGINGLEVKVPSYQIYKQAKKPATLKATVIYNDNGVQPKKKNVEWSVVKDVDGNAFEQNDRLHGMVTAKNGTITVDKNYVLSRTAAENQFYIKVTAKDFADNEVSTVLDKPIEITNEALKIQTLALVKEEGGDSGKTYTAIAVQNAADKKLAANDLKATEVNATKLVVFSDTIGKGKTWTADEYAALQTTVAPENLSFKSNSAKEVEVKADGTIAVIKPKNVKLTASVNDGSKAKADISINIAYDPVTELSLKVEQMTNAGYKEISAEADEVTYKYTDSSYFKLTVKDNNTDAPAFTNYTLKAKAGAKVVGTSGNEVLLATTATTAKVELTNNAEADRTKKTKTYELVNTSASTAKAPSIKTAGSFYDNAAANDQEVQLQIETAKVPEGATAVYAEIDQSARTAKNAEALDAFTDQIKLGILDFEEDTIIVKTTTVVKLKASSSSTVKLTAGSYKLKVTVGKAEDVDGTKSFTPLAKSAAVTVKVDKTKALTFAPGTAYTIDTKDSKSVPFTAKTNAKEDEYSVSYEVYNANIGGRPNNFVELFEVSDDSSVLKLRDNVTDEMLNAIPKGGIVGYLDYEVEGIKEYYTNAAGVSGLVKITVKVNTAKPKTAYAVSGKPEIGNKTGETTSIEITANKKPATITYAMTDTAGWEAKAGAGKITVTYNGTADLTIGSNTKVTLYIVPADSYYISKFAGTDENAPTAETYKAYGIEVKATIKAAKVLTPLETAVKDVTTWIEATKKESPAPEWLTNGLTATSLKAEAEKALVTTLKDGKTATVEIAKKAGADGADTSEDDFKLTAATLTANGKVEGNFKVSVDSDSQKVAFSFTIPKGRITKAEAAELIKNAASVKNITIGNDDDSTVETNGTTPKAAKEKEICDAAKRAIQGSPYTVEVKADAGLTINPKATSSEAGKATITLLVKDGAEDTSGAEAVLEYTIATITE